MSNRNKIKRAAKLLDIEIISLEYERGRDYDYGGPSGEWELYCKIGGMTEEDKTANIEVDDYEWRDGHSICGHDADDLIESMEASVRYYRASENVEHERWRVSDIAQCDWLSDFCFLV